MTAAQITLLANFLKDIHQFDELSDEDVRKFFEETKPLLLGTQFMNTTDRFDQVMRVLAPQEELSATCESWTKWILV